MGELKSNRYVFVIALLLLSLSARGQQVQLNLSLAGDHIRLRTQILTTNKWMLLGWLGGGGNFRAITAVLLRTTQKKPQRLNSELLVLGGMPLQVLHDITWHQSVCSGKAVNVKQQRFSISSQIINPQNNKNCPGR